MLHRVGPATQLPQSPNLLSMPVSSDLESTGDKWAPQCCAAFSQKHAQVLHHDDSRPYGTDLAQISRRNLCEAGCL
jgi:hypothetical protein